MSFADSLSRRRAGGGGAFDAGTSAFAGGGGVAGGVAGGGAAGRVAQGGRAPAAGGGSFSAGQGFGAGGSSTDGGVRASGTVAERAVGAAQAAAETFARAVAALSRALADGADDSQVLGALLADAEGAGRKAHAEISRVPREKLATASKLRTDVEERLDLQLARLRREVAAARLRSNRSASGDAGGSAATSSSQRDQGKTGNFMNGGASPWASELGVRDGSRQVQEEDAVVAEERRMLQEQQKRAEQEAQEIEAQIAFNECVRFGHCSTPPSRAPNQRRPWRARSVCLLRARSQASTQRRARAPFTPPKARVHPCR